MPLSLTAKQNTISEMFSENLEYIIPSYQRPYSWTIDECDQLWEDLIAAFEEEQEDYFLGNIVIAKSSSNPNKLEMIDGQQRLVTITLFLKALHLQLSEIKKIKDKLWINDEWDSSHIQRVTTNVYENNDTDYLNEIMQLTEDKIIIDYKFNRNKNKRNNFENNFYYLYFKLDNYRDKKAFAKFFLEKITLLPILTEDTEQSKAREKALVIFETINNRGLELSDTDIFKAKLYSLALNTKEEDFFTNQWAELTLKSNELKSLLTSNKGPLLDIFRIYSHICRGKEQNDKNEISLRLYFTESSNAILKKFNFKDILSDLDAIINIVTFYKDCLNGKLEYNELTKWFQIINVFPNIYPQWTLFVYIFNNHNIKDLLVKDIDEIIEFSKNLLRISLSKGLVGNVKRDMYKVIIMTTSNESIKLECNEILTKTYIRNQWFGRMKNVFLLLSFYLNEKQPLIKDCYFDKIITKKDSYPLNESWTNIKFDDVINDLGNALVLDRKISRTTLKNKINKVYSNSSIQEFEILMDKLHNWNFEDFKKRNNLMINNIINFIFID